jgi:hypothetical protein
MIWYGMDGRLSWNNSNGKRNLIANNNYHIQGILLWVNWQQGKASKVGNSSILYIAKIPAYLREVLITVRNAHMGLYYQVATSVPPQGCTD